MCEWCVCGVYVSGVCVVCVCDLCGCVCGVCVYVCEWCVFVCVCVCGVCVRVCARVRARARAYLVETMSWNKEEIETTCTVQQ